MDREFSEDDFTQTLGELHDALAGLTYKEILFTLGYFVAETADIFSEGDVLHRDMFLDSLDSEIGTAAEHFDAQEPTEDEEPADEDFVEDDMLDTQMEIHDLLDGYEDTDKLAFLSFAAAEILSEYEEGEDRDIMINFFAESVEEDIDILDSFASEPDDEEDEEPSITEVVDVLAALAMKEAANQGDSIASITVWRNYYRGYVNMMLDTDLPLLDLSQAVYEEINTCTDCGCAIHD